MESELAKVKRQRRAFMNETPAVAEEFLRTRGAEEENIPMNRQLVEQSSYRKRKAQEAQAARDAAKVELERLRRKILDMERQCDAEHALKTFSLEALGAGCPKAGSAKGRKARFEALDRLSKLKAGLSTGQKNDWEWFKENWDPKMLAERKGK